MKLDLMLKTVQGYQDRFHRRLWYFERTKMGVEFGLSVFDFVNDVVHGVHMEIALPKKGLSGSLHASSPFSAEFLNELRENVPCGLYIPVWGSGPGHPWCIWTVEVDFDSAYKYIQRYTEHGVVYHNNPSRLEIVRLPDALGYRLWLYRS